jgi:hypothetical protein
MWIGPDRTRTSGDPGWGRGDSAEKLGMEPVPRAHVEFRFKRPVTHENGFLPFAPPRGALQLMDCPQDD